MDLKLPLQYQIKEVFSMDAKQAFAIAALALVLAVSAGQAFASPASGGIICDSGAWCTGYAQVQFTTVEPADGEGWAGCDGTNDDTTGC
ncbi:MAG: hypothetical protein HY367_03105 [Candidatus Aenigmarchaeota archaeon]|nr:hypothetical protein [Candidatus Aenigmarchaeota archaeon]